MSEILAQIAQLAAWISAGDDYGWLGVYQARRAAFELQSIRAQMGQGRVPGGGGIADRERLAIQARLDRLGACLETARAAMGVD